MEINYPGSGSGSSEAKNSIFGLFLAVLFLTGGVLLGGYGFMQYQGQASNIDNAVNITATVSDTNVRTDSSRRGGIDYQAEISFDYSFEGENYSSDFIYPLDDDREFESEEDAEAFISDYRTGDQIRAYVSPENPGEGFIQKKRSDQPLLFMLIGVMMTLAGGYRTVQRII